jgi:glycerol-3-phosphate dehydrogenase
MMNRNLVAIADNTYDVVVIGGGIYGACIAWEAVLRGLSVALFEKGDFCGATSANSLKIIHGGFRYLQTADIQRMRESIRERRTLMSIAPHLVHPLRVLIPNYGHSIRGREVFQVAVLLNELISVDRNRLDDPQKKIPSGKTVSKQECIRMLPGLPPEDLSGGTVFYDAQVYNSERLVLAFLFSARQRGAQIINYTQVSGFLREGDRIVGVEVEDVLSRQQATNHARMVINAAGPWIGSVLDLLGKNRPPHRIKLAKAVNVITHQLFEDYAVGLPGENGYREEQVAAQRSKSFLFVAPWRNRSLIGTIYSPLGDNPDQDITTGREISYLLKEVNQAYPPAKLREDEVVLVHSGLLPMSGTKNENGEVQLKKHYRILDHRTEGIKGLMTVEGVKYTTARDVAQAVIDQVFKSWGHRPPPSTSADISLAGGQIERFADFLQAETAKRPYELGIEQMRNLVYNYGSLYPTILSYLNSSNMEEKSLPADQILLQAQVRHAVQEEMAVKLADVIFRRTDLGSAGRPDEQIVTFCAQVMGTELNWDSNRVDQELAELKQAYQAGNE